MTIRALPLVIGSALLLGAQSGTVRAAAPDSAIELASLDFVVQSDSRERQTPIQQEAPKALTPRLVALRTQVRRVLAAYYPKHQNARDNSPWEVMHAIIGYGVNTQLYKAGSSGEKVNAISWMCYNGECEGERMLSLVSGKLFARKGPGLQGHYGQFLAILAQSHVKADYPLIVQGRRFTLQDLIEHEQEDCEADSELTFKLIALMHYLDSDATWTSRTGQEWSIQRLISEEIKQPIRGAACGGTHRLMGLSYAVNKRIKRGEPVAGEFARAQAYINNYHRYTFGLQNGDGSFSTEWFTRRGDNPDVDRRLKTTGHIAEWLTFSLNDDEIRDPRMVKAIEYLSGIMVNETGRTWEIGPLGHSIHALSMYDARVFKPHDPPSSTAPVSDRPTIETARNPREQRKLKAAEPADGSAVTE